MKSSTDAIFYCGDKTLKYSINQGNYIGGDVKTIDTCSKCNIEEKDEMYLFYA
jgi:hypothetical protein